MPSGEIKTKDPKQGFSLVLSTTKVMYFFWFVFARELSTTTGQTRAIFCNKNGFMAWNEPRTAHQLNLLARLTSLAL
jgi:hypothetical protein